jgi:hypothetical protein
MIRMELSTINIFIVIFSDAKDLQNEVVKNSSSSLVWVVAGAAEGVVVILQGLPAIIIKAGQAVQYYVCRH